MTHPHRSGRRRDHRVVGGIILSTLVLSTLPGIPRAHADTAAAIVRDSFDRTTASGLGTATVGGDYTVVDGADYLSVSNGAAHVRGVPNTATNAELRGVSAADVTIQESVTLPSFSASSAAMVGMEARLSASGTGYRSWFSVGNDGSVELKLARLSSGGAETPLVDPVTVSGTFTPGTTYRIEMQVSGSSPVKVNARIWPVSGSEPTSPQVQASDSSSSQVTGAGYVALTTCTGRSAKVNTPITLDDVLATTPSTQSAPAPTSPTPSTAAGAAAPGSLNLTAPSGAVYVSPSGNDSASGSASAPKQTLAAAVAAAPSGGTVVVRGGVYHQGEVLLDKPITIQPAAGEAVWFDGSRVINGWTQSGSTWTAPWSVVWDHSASFDQGSNYPALMPAGHPMAPWPDQIYLDGVQLQQVDGTSTPVTAGTFAVNQANKTVTIGTNPSGHEVRGSDCDRLFTISSPNVTVMGFGVRRYANALWRQGVIYDMRQNTLIQNVTLEDIATTAITMSSDHTHGGGRVDHVTTRRTGILGVQGDFFDNGAVTNSLITQNNTEGFTPFPATAGIKVTRSRHLLFDGNVISDSPNTTGIWTDMSVVDVTAVRNRVLNCTFAGIQLELTQTGVVADNIVSGAETGIYIFDSGYITVRNNTTAASVVAGISLDQDFRRQTDKSVGSQDPRYPIPDPTNTWITSNVVVQNNLFGPCPPPANFQLWVLDKNNAFRASQMLANASGNLFQAKASNVPSLIAWGQNLDGDVVHYNDLSAWVQSFGANWTNATYSSTASITDAIGAASASTIGTPLPSDIAAKIGQSAGSTHIGAYQSWN